MRLRVCEPDCVRERVPLRVDERVCVRDGVPVGSCVPLLSWLALCEGEAEAEPVRDPDAEALPLPVVLCEALSLRLGDCDREGVPVRVWEAVAESVGVPEPL